MPLRLPPLAALRIFEAAARLGSFKEAAGELGLTPSAVSHGIGGLEKWLALTLFDRSSNAMPLTVEGRRYLPYVTEGLSLIALGTERLALAPDRPRIAVSAAPSFAAGWLVPRLARFRAAHPEVSIIIDTSPRQALFPLDGVDLAVRRGKGPWPGTRSELLFTEAIVPVGTADYLGSLRQDGKALDWTRATLLAVTSVEQDWSTWFAATGAPPPSGTARLSFDTIPLALDAAAAGLGIALGREPLLASHPAATRLYRVTDTAMAIETGYWLCRAAGEEPRREIRAFWRWLLAEARNGALAAAPNAPPG